MYKAVAVRPTVLLLVLSTCRLYVPFHLRIGIWVASVDNDRIEFCLATFLSFFQHQKCWWKATNFAIHQQNVLHRGRIFFRGNINDPGFLVYFMRESRRASVFRMCFASVLFIIPHPCNAFAYFFPCEQLLSAHHNGIFISTTVCTFFTNNYSNKEEYVC